MFSWKLVPLAFSPNEFHCLNSLSFILKFRFKSWYSTSEARLSFKKMNFHLLLSIWLFHFKRISMIFLWQKSHLVWLACKVSVSFQMQLSSKPSLSPFPPHPPLQSRQDLLQTFHRALTLCELLQNYCCSRSILGDFQSCCETVISLVEH